MIPYLGLVLRGYWGLPRRAKETMRCRGQNLVLVHVRSAPLTSGLQVFPLLKLLKVTVALAILSALLPVPRPVIDEHETLVIEQQLWCIESFNWLILPMAFMSFRHS